MEDTKRHHVMNLPQGTISPCTRDCWSFSESSPRMNFREQVPFGHSSPSCYRHRQRPTNHFHWHRTTRKAQEVAFAGQLFDSDLPAASRALVVRGRNTRRSARPLLPRATGTGQVDIFGFVDAACWRWTRTCHVPVGGRVKRCK